MAELDGVKAAASRVEEVVLELGAGRDQALIVLVDGPAGSGKTTIATEIASRLGATLVHMDSIYRGWDGLEAGSEIAASIVAELSAGKTAAFTQWDWEAGAEGGQVEVQPAELVIVEGVGSASAAARAHAGLVVWIEAEADLRYKRAIERDGEVFAAQWDAWAEQETEHFTREGTRSEADSLINTGAA